MTLKISTKLVSLSGGRIGYWCPGCNQLHQIPVEGANAWQWNRNIDAPSFSPSILVTTGHYLQGHNPEDGCWCTYQTVDPDCDFKCVRCHAYVTQGKIHFLSDCSHALKDQVVDLPDYPLNK